jgi:hypothetical protein
MRLMHDGAADSVVGVRGKPVERASAPHPTPLPVKNGEREQTERGTADHTGA